MGRQAPIVRLPHADVFVHLVWDPGVVVEEALNVGFVPAVASDGLGVLGREYDVGLAAVVQVREVGAHFRHRVSDRRQDADGIVGDVIVAVVGRLGAEEGDGALVGIVAPLDVKRLEGRRCFVLCDAEAVLVWSAVGGLVSLAGDGATGVHIDEGQRPADRRICPPALAVRVVAAVDVESVGDRSIDDDSRPTGVGRREHPVEVELVRRRGIEGGEHHWEVVGLDPRHDRVRGGGLDVDRRVRGWYLADHLVGRPVRRLEDGVHTIPRRLDDRQSVG